MQCCISDIFRSWHIDVVHLVQVQEAFAKVYNAVEHFKSQHGDMEDIVGEADLTPDDLEEIADEIQLQTELYDKVNKIFMNF